MFKVVHFRTTQHQILLKTTGIAFWHVFGKQKDAMKEKMTYREITLLVGILVAVIIFILIWFNPSMLDFHQAVEPVPGTGLLPAVKSAIQQSQVILQLIR